MAASAFGRHPIAVSVACALVFAVVVAQVGLALPIRDEWQHAVSHLGPGIAALFLIVASRLAWPTAPDNRLSRVARRVLVTGVAIFATGQIVEAAGAFGYSGNARVSSISRLHDVGVLLSPVGLLVTLAGLTSSVFVGVSRRRGAVKPSTIAVAVLVAVVVVVTYVVAGILFGF